MEQDMELNITRGQWLIIDIPLPVGPEVILAKDISLGLDQVTFSFLAKGKRTAMRDTSYDPKTTFFWRNDAQWLLRYQDNEYPFLQPGRNEFRVEITDLAGDPLMGVDGVVILHG
jgi:hypothetical protein